MLGSIEEETAHFADPTRLSPSLSLSLAASLGSSHGVLARSQSGYSDSPTLPTDTNDSFSCIRKRFDAINIMMIYLFFSSRSNADDRVFVCLILRPVLHLPVIRLPFLVVAFFFPPLSVSFATGSAIYLQYIV